MLILIHQDQICGQVESAEGLPSGFEVIETEIEAPIESLYFADGEIRQKPERPSDAHVWTDSRWVELERFSIPEASAQEDWQGLFVALHETPIWARVYEASGRTLKANRAFTLLLNTLTTSRNLATFVFAIADMREALQGISAIGDFDTAELAMLNELLQQYQFGLKVA
jgi:hypothetical protein